MSIASDTQEATTWTPFTGWNTFSNLASYSGTKTNTSKTAGSIASNYQDAAEGMFGEAISGLQGLLGSLGDGGSGAGTSGFNIGDLGSYKDFLSQLSESKGVFSGVQSAASGIASDYNERANESAGKFDSVIGNLSGINDSIGGAIGGIEALQGKYEPVFDSLSGIKDELGSIANDIDNIIPGYAGQLNDMGQSIFGTGGTLVDMGGIFNTQATNLMNMDGSGGGLVEMYVNALSSIDPERYVSMAAADTQRQYQNAMAQQNRQLGRSGVDAGSARSVALNQQYAQSMAAASAGAKFRARIQGQNERLAAVDTAMKTAGSLAQTGASITSAGASTQAAGAGLIGQAANLELSGVNSKLNVQNAQLGVQNAWLNALGSQLQNYNSQISGYNAQAAIQGQISQTEQAKLQGYQSAAQLGLTAQGVISDAEKAKLSGSQAAAQMEANAALSTYNSNLSARVQAATALASAQQAAGQVYLQEAADWGKIAGTGGLMSSLFG